MIELGIDMDLLPEILGVDRDRISLAKKRQVAFWRREKPSAWPVLLTAPLSAMQEMLPKANFQEAFYDSHQMLLSQLRGVCGMLNAGSDAVPSVRANLGTAVTLACLGLKQEVFVDKMPWLQERLTRKQVASLEPDDIKIQGDFERGLEYMQDFREILGDRVAVYCMDTQGPFDLAHLLLGDDLFYAIYDDPPLVHHLMEICLAAGIKTHTWMKEINGEPIDTLYHSNSIFAENMGVRICEDTPVIIGPEAIYEFAMPYSQRLASHFGGAWVHYCGRNDELTKAILSMPEIRGINFGHIPGHEQLHDFEADMQLCLESKKVYFGNWPLLEGESGRAFLARMFRWACQGVLLTSANPAVDRSRREEGFFENGKEALDYWYSLG